MKHMDGGRGGCMQGVIIFVPVSQLYFLNAPIFSHFSHSTRVKGEVCVEPSGPYCQSALNPVSIKQMGVFPLPPEWDASPSQGYPQYYVVGPHLYTWVERGTMRVKCLAQENNTSDPGRGSNLDRSIQSPTH